MRLKELHVLEKAISPDRTEEGDPAEMRTEEDCEQPGDAV